jgi:hypothetical protein
VVAEVQRMAPGLPGRGELHRHTVQLPGIRQHRARTENVQVHPQWGIMLSRLWVQ